MDGRLEARPWTDQQGQVRAGLEVIGDTVEFMSARQQDGDDQAPRASVADERRENRRMPEAMAVAGARGPAADIEDLPF